jgi:hypothetical protein
MQVYLETCTMSFVGQFLEMKEILPNVVQIFFIFRFVYLHFKNLAGPLLAEIEHATYQNFWYLFLCWLV